MKEEILYDALFIEIELLLRFLLYIKNRKGSTVYIELLDIN